MESVLAGPILFARGVVTSQLSLAALMITNAQADSPPSLRAMDDDLITPQPIWRDPERVIWRYDFSLPLQENAYYHCDTETININTNFSDDLRIAYVSCNGQEDSDFERPQNIRNALWADLATEHDNKPLHLLLHGGDQLYADEVWHCHPEFSAWRKLSSKQKYSEPLTNTMAQAALDFYFDRYLRIYTQTPIAYLLARVPSLMMWDDHDIFDGWGSLKPKFQNSPVAQGVFQTARTAFCLFQLGAHPDDLPAMCPLSNGVSLSWCADFPGFSVIAPDLRSERRPHRILGESGWQALQTMFADTENGKPVLLMSSVPIIGPRLSVLEALLHIIPKAQKYEDDLRDQWQSHAHRSEWQRLLKFIEQQALAHQQAITILSGEIHLATRGTFELDGKTVHQLVASGIAHSPPPKLFASILGMLARLGENPLPHRPTKLRPLPGHRSIYRACRNYLLLQRQDNVWTARWRLEDNGWTEALTL